VQNALLLMPGSPLDRLCRDYGFARSGVRFGVEDVHQVWAGALESGAAVPPRLDAALDRIMAHLAVWCADDALPVVACVAGGRKDMAVLFAQVFSLLARPQDRLCHLFTSPAFEHLAEFFYPPPQPETLAVHRSGHGVVFLNSAEARVDLVEIPLVRLRPLLDDEVRRGAVSLELTRQRVQQEVDRHDRDLHVMPATREMVYQGVRVVLPPREFAVLLFFARARALGWGVAGWISGHDLDRPEYVSALEDAYLEVSGREEVRRDEPGQASHFVVPRTRDNEVDFPELKLKITHAVSKIKASLGAAHPGRVQSRPARGGRMYGIGHDPERIVVHGCRVDHGVSGNG
jgi:CRISPR-associated protein (TIGR02584 family)